MPSREERLAQNEVRFREINESAQPQRESLGDGRFVCECADRGCMAWLEVPTAEYLAVREHPRRFIVAPSHEIPDVETVIERRTGYFVVEKPDDLAHIVGDDEQQ
jgi:hypothetical protein